MANDGAIRIGQRGAFRKRLDRNRRRALNNKNTGLAKVFTRRYSIADRVLYALIVFITAAAAVALMVFVWNA